MGRLFAGLLVVSAACGRKVEVPQTLVDAGITAAPDVITLPSAVVFWLKDVDTLEADSAVAAVHDVTSQAQDLVDLVSDTDVQVYFTTESRIYVRAQLAPRRIVTLNGLDYPWGVVLVEPGYAEQIITGPVAPIDLRDLVYEYFGFENVRPQGPIASGESSIWQAGDWERGVGSRFLVLAPRTNGTAESTKGQAFARP
jgi:hypothetical protein